MQTRGQKLKRPATHTGSTVMKDAIAKRRRNTGDKANEGDPSIMIPKKKSAKAPVKLPKAKKIEIKSMWYPFHERRVPGFAAQFGRCGHQFCRNPSPSVSHHL